MISLLSYSILMSLLILNMINGSTETIYDSNEIDSKNISSSAQKSSIISISSSSKIKTGQFRLGTIYCLFLSVLVKYFRSTTYFWMFNEAFYLHQLMARVFATPHMKSLISLAYGVPLLTNTSYIIVRSISSYSSGSQGSSRDSSGNVINIPDNQLSVQGDICWLLPSPSAWQEWIINAPNLSILVVSILFSLSFQNLI